MAALRLVGADCRVKWREMTRVHFPPTSTDSPATGDYVLPVIREGWFVSFSVEPGSVIVDDGEGRKRIVLSAITYVESDEDHCGEDHSDN